MGQDLRQNFDIKHDLQKEKSKTIRIQKSSNSVNSDNKKKHSRSVYYDVSCKTYLHLESSIKKAELVMKIGL